MRFPSDIYTLSGSLSLADLEASASRSTSVVFMAVSLISCLGEPAVCFSSSSSDLSLASSAKVLPSSVRYSSCA